MNTSTTEEEEDQPYTVELLLLNSTVQDWSSSASKYSADPTNGTEGSERTRYDVLRLRAHMKHHARTEPLSAKVRWSRLQRIAWLRPQPTIGELVGN